MNLLTHRFRFWGFDFTRGRSLTAPQGGTGRRSPGLRPRRKVGEAGFSVESIMPIVVGVIVIGVLAYFGWTYLHSTDQEGRDFAEQSVQRLLFRHDADYLEKNLNPKVRPRFPLLERQDLMKDLTKLGAPIKPVKLQGTVGLSSSGGTQDPEGRFEAPVDFRAVQARLHLNVIRHSGRWWIDLIAFDWKSKVPPRQATPVPTPTATLATPTPLPEP
jgi:hypothetical protein